MSYEEYFEAVMWYTLIAEKLPTEDAERIAGTMHRYEWSVRRQYESGAEVRMASRMIRMVI